MSQRIKGQEVSLVFTGPLGVEEGLIDVKSFEYTMNVETLEEGYLGETANRFDDIYNGHSGTAEFDVETALFLTFQESVQDRATRRSPASLVFNVVSSFDFPSGERARLVFEDVFWGDMPMNASGRPDYVNTSVDWKCSTVRRIL